MLATCRYLRGSLEPRGSPELRVFYVLNYVPVPELRVSYVLNYVPCTIRVCLRVLTTCLIYVPSLRVFYVFPSTSWTTGRVLRAFYVFNYVTPLYCVPCTCLTTWQP